MDLRRCFNPLTLVLAMQLFVVIAGTLTTTMALKFNGYPHDPMMIWNPFAVFVRDWGLLGLAVPCVWLVATLKRGGGHFTLKGIGIGIGIALVLSFFYCWSAANPAKRGILLAVPEDETSEQDVSQENEEDPHSPRGSFRTRVGG